MFRFKLFTLLFLHVLQCLTSVAETQIATNPLTPLPTPNPTIPATTSPLTPLPTTNPTISATTNPLTNPPPTEPPTPLSIGAIVGIAVGCSAFIVLVLAFCVCLCCCVRRRRNQAYNPASTSKTAIATQLSDTLTYAATPSDMNGFHEPKSLVESENKHELEMQMNDSVAVTDLELMQSEETTITLSPHHSQQMAATSTQALQQSLTKGYIKMSSAGSVLPLTIEADNNIYDNADSTISADLHISTSTQRLHAHNTPGPPTSPKPIRLRTSRERLGELEVTVTGETDVTDVMDDGQDENAYVETNVFLQDRQQQESDNYYNKDTIETIRHNRSLINVVDPVQTHAVYANIDPPPTPEHSLKPKKDKEDFENINEFLGSTHTAASPLSPQKTEYYNYKPSVTGNMEDSDYNYVEVTKPGTENPYALENNQYIDMSRSESSPAHQPAVKYQNLVYMGGEAPVVKTDAQGYTYLEYLGGDQGGDAPTVKEITSSNKSLNVMAEISFPPSASSSSVGSTKRPTYVNLLPEGVEEL